MGREQGKKWKNRTCDLQATREGSTPENQDPTINSYVVL